MEFVDHCEWEPRRYTYWSFSIICHFLPNPGRILPALTCNGSQLLMSMLAGFCQDLAENDELQKNLNVNVRKPKTLTNIYFELLCSRYI